MAFSFADLKENPPKLPPVEVPIEGFSEPLLIHQFTLSELEKLDDDISEGDDAERRLRTQVVQMLNGPGVPVTDEDRNALSKIFAGWQLRKIFAAGMKLNGLGPEALREAEKN